MPELPEVEVAARSLRTWSAGRVIVRCEVDPRAKRMTRPDAPGAIVRACTDARIDSVDRRGKHLLLTLEAVDRSRFGVHAHLGMSGKWVRRAAGDAVPWSRIRLHLDDGTVIHDRDPRMFGRFHLVPDARFESLAEIASLGPDPLHDGIDARLWVERFACARRPVKLLLLDQSLAPGVGNIHASEALFRARIDPRRDASSLSPREVRALGRAVLASIGDVLAAVDGTEITYVEEAGAANPFPVYGREGERCPRCRSGRIERIVQAQRSSFFCARCQH